MTDQNLPELLEQAADRTPVGPAPIAGIVTGATRVRRRRAALTMVGAAAAAIVGGAVVFAVPDGPSNPQPLVATPEPDPTPAGMRLAGLGHAAVAVPQTWSTNVFRCGVPMEDTVIVDIGAALDCNQPRPEGVDSVTVDQGDGKPWRFTVDDVIQIGGVPAERQATTCHLDERVRICAGTVYIPSMDVAFRAESSTKTAVDRILDRIQIFPDQVGVPGEYRAKTKEEYVEALSAAGLTAEIRTEQTTASAPGYVLEVSPVPGTMLQPGDAVTVTVSA
ncbi:PASTA domain-containing protein [Haloactinopolyspora alba]|uniref:PASTA domain-containing protein n=1 Tax=Haloactinopolyspora alba TaxID=648780 RepID=A0A2P8EF41_9ACTN|nr:PASTA domain-containing protein [Haloactinopolyspora alba]PSL08085.1 PASTA domain-containing protein [Haloactinopolyspora alba]